MAGTQLGLALIVAVVGIALTSVIELGHWFDVPRLIGAGLCKRSALPNAINDER